MRTKLGKRPPRRFERLERRELLAAELLQPVLVHETGNEQALVHIGQDAEGEQVGNSVSDSGGFEGSQQTLMLSGNGGGTLRYQYEHFTIPDNFILRYEGRNLFETGFTGGSANGEVQVPAGNSNQVQVIVATNDEGTAWNYSVSEESCGDTGVFEVSVAGGMFMPSTGADGALVCSATGTIYVGLKDGPTRMLRIDNAEANYDDKRLVINGGTVSSELFATDGPLFVGDLSFDLTNPRSTVSETPSTQDFAIGGQETEFTSITLSPDGIHLEGGFSLPPSNLLLGLTGADLDINLAGATALVISDRGIGFGSDVGKTDFPTNKGFSLFNFIGLTNASAKIQYIFEDAGTPVNRLKIQGKFQINELNFLEFAEDFSPRRLTLDLTDDVVADREGFIQVENGVIDLAGEIKLTNVPLPFGFELSELYAQLETTGGILTDVTGGAKVKLPPKSATPFPPQREVFAEVGFERVASGWVLDDVVLEFDSLNIPVPSTPVFWQRIRGGVKNIAPDAVPTSYTGGLGFTVGPKFDSDLPGWLPFDVGEVSLSRIDGNAESNGRFYTIDGAVNFVDDRIFKAEGRITLDLDREFFQIAANLEALGGLVNGNADVKIEYGNRRGHAAGDASLQFPDSRLFFGLRNKTVAQGNFLLRVSFDGNPTNDFISAWSKFDLPFAKEKTIGVQFFMDGDWRIIGRRNVPVTGSFTVDENTDYLLMTADWDNDAGRDVEVRVVDPDGNRIAEADFASHGIALVPDLSSGFATTVMVNEPTSGIWDIEVVDPTGLNDIQISADRESVEPTLSFDTVTVQSDGTVEVSINAFDSDSNASVSLFYDSDSDGFDGRFIADGISEADGTTTFTWDPANVPEGDYTVYAVIQDDLNAPVFVYSDTPIRVGEDVDLELEIAPNQFLFPSGGPAQVDVVVSSDSSTDVAIDVNLVFSDPVTFTSSSPFLAGQSGTEFLIDAQSLLGSGNPLALPLEFTLGSGITELEMLAEVQSTSFDPDNSNNQSAVQLNFDSTDAMVNLGLELSDAPEVVDVGQPYTYTITVTNDGTKVANDVVLTEALPVSVRLESANASQGTVSQQGSVVVANLGTIQPGASLTLEITAIANSAGTLISNSTVTSSDGDSATIDNFLFTAAQVNTAAPQPADVSLSLSSDTDRIAIDDQIAFTVSLANAGPGVGSGILVELDLPEALQFVSFSAVQGSFNPATSVWNVGNVRDGLTRTITVFANAVISFSGDITAELVAINEQDPDSSPDNGDVSEDDQDSVSLTIAPNTRIYVPSLVARPHVIPGDGVPTAIIFQAISDTTVSVLPIGSVSVTENVRILDGDLLQASAYVQGIATADLEAGSLYAIIFEPQLGNRIYSVRSSAGYDALGNSPSNVFDPTDTNADGRTSAMDALVVINQLSRNARFAEGEFAPSQLSYFTDVNRDGKTSPLDALLVINRLSRQAFSRRVQGEGEAISGLLAKRDFKIRPDSVVRNDDFGLPQKEVAKIMTQIAPSSGSLHIDTISIATDDRVATSESVDRALDELFSELELEF